MSENVFSFGPSFASEMEDVPGEGTPPILIIDGVDHRRFEKHRRLILTDTVEQQLHAMRYFRRLLSVKKNPPIDAVIDAGLVPRFVQFLENDSQKELQFEAAWALTNIASGEDRHSTTLVDHGVIAIFIRLIRTGDPRIVEQAAWGIGNLVGGNAEIRDLCLTEGAMPPLVEAAGRVPTHVPMVRNVTWAISNLCRGKPKPSLALVSPAIPVLAHLLRATNDESITADAVWALSFISDISEEAVDMVLETGIASHLVALLSASTPLTVKTVAVITVESVLSGNEGHMECMIDAGVITALGEILEVERVVIRRDACRALSNIAAGNSQQVQALFDATPPLFPKIVELLKSSNLNVRKEALWVMTNVLESCSWDSVLYLVDTLQILRQLCDLLSIDNATILSVALRCIHKLLKRASDKGQLDRFTAKLADLNAVGAIENLQSHANAEVRQDVVSLLDTLIR